MREIQILRKKVSELTVRKSVFVETLLPQIFFDIFNKRNDAKIKLAKQLAVILVSEISRTRTTLSPAKSRKIGVVSFASGTIYGVLIAAVKFF